MGKIIAIIQARIDSTRLPGKTLMDIGGYPMIWHVLNRAFKISKVSKVALTVPVGQRSHFKDIADKFDVEIFEGPHPDLLTSYYQVAEKLKPDIIVRITGDCWAIVPEISDKVIDLFFKGYSVYTANINPPTMWPDGLDTEVFDMDALKFINENILSTFEERHHVTTFLRNYAYCKYLRCDGDYSKHKLSVDTQEDLDRARRIYAKLPGPDWTWEDLKKVLDDGYE